MFSKTDIPNDSDRQLSQKVFGLSRVQFLRGGLEEMHLQDKQSNQKLTFSGLHPLTAEVTLLLGGGGSGNICSKSHSYEVHSLLSLQVMVQLLGRADREEQTLS